MGGRGAYLLLLTTLQCRRPASRHSSSLEPPSCAIAAPDGRRRGLERGREGERKGGKKDEPWMVPRCHVQSSSMHVSVYQSINMPVSST